MKKTFRLFALVLTLLFAFTLVACAPKDASAAKKKMEKKDYTVIVVTDSKEAEEGVVAIISGTKGALLGEKEAFVAVQYDSTKNAKAAYEKALGEDHKENESVQRVGKWVIVGTSQAIKDFK